jgi:hypothetical protein
MQFSSYPRAKAFLWHLGGSLFLGLVALALVFHVWYPSPLNAAVGVTTIFLILVSVDVVLGPVLTLVVFNPQKKTLKMDLTAIVLVQLCAFAYGLWTVAEARPAWIVFNSDRFDVVQAVDIDRRKIADAKPEYQEVSWFGPKWVAATSPSDEGERKQILMEAVMAGVDIAQRPNRYQPLDSAEDKIREKSRDLSLLKKFNPPGVVDETLKKYPDADAWLPLKGRVSSVVVLVSRRDANIVAVADLSPWG